MTSAHPEKRLILLDAHAILHRAYHALPDFSTASGIPTGALYGLSAMLIKIIEDVPLRARLEKAAQLASKRYDISECMRLMQQIYDDVLKERKR